MQIFTVSNAFHLFLRNQIFLWKHFSLAWRNILNICYSEGLLVTYFVRVFLSWNFFMSPSFLRIFSEWHRILHWQLFKFLYFKYIIPLSLAYMVSNEKSVFICIVILLYLLHLLLFWLVSSFSPYLPHFAIGTMIWIDTWVSLHFPFSDLLEYVNLGHQHSLSLWPF